MQVVENNKQTRFWVFKRWGRVGAKSPQTATEECSTLQAALTAFKKVYTAKTGGNHFGDGGTFKPVEGKYTHVSGAVHEGQYKKGKRHGVGTASWKDKPGHLFEGNWVNGMKVQGKHTFGAGVDQGAVYEGQWHNRHYHGAGVAVFANGDRYDGQWQESKKQGQGIYRFSNGEVYDGQWKEGVYHGQGKSTFTDGAFLEGRYADGKEVGLHTGLEADGSPVEQEFGARSDRDVGDIC